MKASNKVFVQWVLSRELVIWSFFLFQGWALVPEADAQACWVRRAWQVLEVHRLYHQEAMKRPSVSIEMEPPGRWTGSWPSWGQSPDSPEAWSGLRKGQPSLWPFKLIQGEGVQRQREKGSFEGLGVRHSNGASSSSRATLQGRNYKCFLQKKQTPRSMSHNFPKVTGHQYRTASS